MRKSNFELMRIVSMLFIVIGHALYHGRMLQNCLSPSLLVVIKIFYYIYKANVISFVILTGYFQCKSKMKLKRVFKLIGKTIFYSISIYLIFLKLGWITNYNIVTIFNSFNLTSISQYSYITSYLVLYLLSDYLNIVVDNLEKEKRFGKFLILLAILFTFIPFFTGGRIISNRGNNFIQFIYLYFIGAYLRNHKIKDLKLFKKMKNYQYAIILFTVFILATLANGFLNYFLAIKQSEGYIWQEVVLRLSHTDYSSPFIVLQGILYFSLFEMIDFKSKFINYISKSCIAVYLIHDNPYIRSKIWTLIGINQKFSSVSFLFSTVLICICIFISCIFIDKIRCLIIYVFKCLLNKIKCKIDVKQG